MINLQMKKVRSCTSFWLSWSKKCNCHIWQCQEPHKMLMPMPMASHDQNISCSSFQLSWPKNCLGDVADAITIICHWHQCNWYHMTKLHLISIIFTQGMQWCHFVLLMASCDPKTGANGITWAKIMLYLISITLN